jgi:uncharacterized protein DUF4386
VTSVGNPGRSAGSLYLLTSIVGFFAMGYVPDKLIVHGNAAATANNIAAHEMPAFFGEIAFIFWLVIKGAKPPAVGAAASAAS